MSVVASADPAVWAAVVSVVVSVVLHLAAGAGVGAVHFGGLWWNARLFAAGGRMATAIAVALGRFAVVGGVLVVAARDGAPALLATALGLLIARALVMRRVWGTAP